MVEEKVDVLVAGAGPAGMMAAIAAARENASVRLIERHANPGGMNTTSLVGPLMGFYAGHVPIIRGLAQEVIDRLAARGGTLGHLPDPIGVTSAITPVDAALLKQVYFDMLREERNLQLHLGMFVSNAKYDKKRVNSITAIGKGGARMFEASVFIDATGDGDLAAFTKQPFTVGRVWDEFSQPMTLMMKIGGIDFNQVCNYVKAHPEQFILGNQGADMQYVAISGYFDKVAHAKANGSLTLNRDRVLLFQGIRPGEAIVNMTRVVKKDGTNADDLTQAEMDAHAQVDDIMRFLTAHIDGFENCFLIQTGDSIGVRETRHIMAAYMLTEEDVLSCAEFEDCIAMCAFPIDIHDPSDQGLLWTKTDSSCCYDIPYRVMLPMKATNLLVTGRCVGATHEASASARITPTVMAMGQAAGIAAAMASQKDADVTAVSVRELQSKIVAQGGMPGRAFLSAFDRKELSCEA